MFALISIKEGLIFFFQEQSIRLLLTRAVSGIFLRGRGRSKDFKKPYKKNYVHFCYVFMSQISISVGEESKPLTPALDTVLLLTLKVLAKFT